MYLTRQFRARAGNRQPDDTEDLLQEARLGLLHRLRTADTLEDAEKYYTHVLRYLYSHVRRMAPVHFPEKRFSEGVRKLEMVCWEYIGDDEPANSFEDDLINDIDLGYFIRSLEPIEQRVLSMRLQEHTQKEIASIVANGNESKVSRIMKRIRSKYLAFQEDENHAI